ncbi:hypothetical protein ASF99_04925 [Exiguobacterium sp. Leaf187]|uniref:hypothetical protein n=1 Tax=Exiguobacterium sp. Leaf187 TaxID=1736294 RepID=UPI0006FBD5CB|nr:hypothetical protein [Exiguobacterium sp. Leaf187]KQS19232.1 hypothetical protein ASF99_04925 [Exiguobacterium sp. Leaf187]
MRIRLTDTDEARLDRRIAEHESRGARFLGKEQYLHNKKEFATEYYTGRKRYVSSHGNTRHTAYIELPDREKKGGVT